MKQYEKVNGIINNLSNMQRNKTSNLFSESRPHRLPTHTQKNMHYTFFPHTVEIPRKQKMKMFSVFSREPFRDKVQEENHVI